MSKKKNQQYQVDAIKAIWEKYSDIVLEGYATQIDEISRSHEPFGGPQRLEIKTITDKMKAFRHEFNKKT